jgi:hypothetical protein
MPNIDQIPFTYRVSDWNTEISNVAKVKEIDWQTKSEEDVYYNINLDETPGKV